MTEPTREVLSFCRISAANCGITVEVDGERVVHVRGDAGHPDAREGYTCTKGRALGTFHHDPDRLDDPLVDGAVTAWDAALERPGRAPRCGDRRARRRQRIEPRTWVPGSHTT